jgi:hypothetical protein
MANGHSGHSWVNLEKGRTHWKMRRGAAGTPVALQQAMKVVWLVISGSQRYALFAVEETQT